MSGYVVGLAAVGGGVAGFVVGRWWQLLTSLPDPSALVHVGWYRGYPVYVLRVDVPAQHLEALREEPLPHLSAPAVASPGIE